MCIGCFLACKEQPKQLSFVKGQQIQINDSIPAEENIEEFIRPYRERITQEMEGKLSYTPKAMYKSDYKLNTPLGNMMADAVMEMANPVFKSKTGRDIDIVLLNYGGIRSGINAGAITTKTAYNIMPFENKVAVAELSSKELQLLVDYLVKNKTAHPISGLQIILNAEGNLEEFNINAEPIQEQSYYVATSDYLVKGGDSMDFFLSSKYVQLLDYKLRNVFIDYFEKKDSIDYQRDERFYQLED